MLSFRWECISKWNCRLPKVTNIDVYVTAWQDLCVLKLQKVLYSTLCHHKHVFVGLVEKKWVEVHTWLHVDMKVRQEVCVSFWWVCGSAMPGWPKKKKNHYSEPNSVFKPFFCLFKYYLPFAALESWVWRSYTTEYRWRGNMKMSSLFWIRNCDQWTTLVIGKMYLWLKQLLLLIVHLMKLGFSLMLSL